MKHVLIHATPRSGSKTLQSAIQEYLIQKYHDVVMLENRSIDYGLDEFFVSRQGGSAYKIYDLTTHSWLLKHAYYPDTIPEGGLWEKLIITDKGNLKWTFIPANPKFAKGPVQFLVQQNEILSKLYHKAYVAKMFTGFGLYNDQALRTMEQSYRHFDTHIVLRRRNNLDNFLSRLTCRRTGNWSAIGQTADCIDVDKQQIEFSEFNQWHIAMQDFEMRIANVPMPRELWMEDFTSSISIPGTDITIPIPNRETIEYGDKKYQWVKNLAEVKQWFKDYGYEVE